MLVQKTNCAFVIYSMTLRWQVYLRVCCLSLTFLQNSLDQPLYKDTFRYCVVKEVTNHENVIPIASNSVNKIEKLNKFANFLMDTVNLPLNHKKSNSDEEEFCVYLISALFFASLIQFDLLCFGTCRARD